MALSQQAPKQQNRPKINIRFQKIELLKNKTLGVGSYGSVCKAKCDDLVCAAKIIHPTLVPADPQEQISRERIHRLPIMRFEAECDFLRDINHPNIIQFLGMYQDPETGLPVLLMELMDESLTHFLESSAEPTPYHIQVVICQDISTALSFLHLNGIIHRDLSSNNILLSGKGTRAKLTDFGMAKLTNANFSRVSNTVCPGTDAYMPPEAMDNQAVYSEKGDVFSFGVNLIQIVTKKFPKPGDRFKTVPIDDPRFPSGSIRMCVSEVERRSNQISKVDEAHPLRPIALDCLNDQEGERPSASQLCDRISALKDTPEYKVSEDKRTTEQTVVAELRQQVKCLQEMHERVNAEKDHLLTNLRQDLEQQKLQDEHLRQEMQSTQQAQLSVISEKDCINFDLRQQLQSEQQKHREEIYQLTKHSQQMQETIKAEKNHQITELQSQLSSKQQELDKRAHYSQDTLTAREQEIQDLKEKLQATLEEKERVIREKDEALREIDQVVAARDDSLKEIDQVSASRQDEQRDHKETLTQFQRRIEELEISCIAQHYPQPETCDSPVQHTRNSQPPPVYPQHVQSQGDVPPHFGNVHPHVQSQPLSGSPQSQVQPLGNSPYAQANLQPNTGHPRYPQPQVQPSGSLQHVQSSGSLQHVQPSGSLQHVQSSGSLQHVQPSGSLQHIQHPVHLQTSFGNPQSQVRPQPLAVNQQAQVRLQPLPGNSQPQVQPQPLAVNQQAQVRPQPLPGNPQPQVRPQPLAVNQQAQVRPQPLPGNPQPQVRPQPLAVNPQAQVRPQPLPGNPQPQVQPPVVYGHPENAPPSGDWIILNPQIQPTGHPQQVHPQAQLNVPQPLQPSSRIQQIAPTQPLQPPQNMILTNRLPKPVKLNWTRGRKAPCEFYRTTDVVMAGSVAYFRPNGGTREVYSFDTTADIWSKLPDFPTGGSTLTTVNGLLTTVGGYDSNKLISLMGESVPLWIEEFPPMPTKRYDTIAINTQSALIVAGGKGELSTVLTNVEVMNASSLQWSTATSLPKPMSLATATICNDYIYMSVEKQVIISSLSVLFQSCRQTSLEPPSTTQNQVWSYLAAIPVKQSTLVSINDRILAIGGRDSADNPSGAVRIYNPLNNSWNTISTLVTPRWLCLAVAVSEKKIMIVGGYSSQNLITSLFGRTFVSDTVVYGHLV